MVTVYLITDPHYLDLVEEQAHTPCTCDQNECRHHGIEVELGQIEQAAQRAQERDARRSQRWPR